METRDIKGTYVPCGHCYACIQTKRSVWTFRVMNELKDSFSARFVTLTYNDNHVPFVQSGNKVLMTLRREHLTNFLKLLRWRISEDYVKVEPYFKQSEKSGKWSPKVRYFASGEYGGKSKRPHYHIALFNVPRDVYKFDPIHKDEYSNYLADIWKKGNVDIKKVSQGTAHYLTKYHLHPLVGWNEDDQRERFFATMSRKPGIGNSYINDAITNYFDNTANCYGIIKDGHKVPLGRYYKEKIKEFVSPETIFRMSQGAKRAAEEKTERLRASFDSEGDFLKYKREIAKTNRAKVISQLKRNNKI